MSVINVDHLTKDYGHGRGVFDVSLSVEKGECYGFLGPNGAGKTTTIRHLMGFSKPQKGSCTISGKDTWTHQAELKREIGYLPGEIAFPKGMTGSEFLHYMQKLRGMKNLDYCQSLLQRFELDPRMHIHDMSLGVRRKLAVVTAFMHDPEILILDEPTSGLDPVMQQKFIDFIKTEKQRGKTILLSSHIFHEVDATCDKISIIKGGHIVSAFKAEELKAATKRIYLIRFHTREDFDAFCSLHDDITSRIPAKNQIRLCIEDWETNWLLADLADRNVADIEEIPFTLEDYFMQFYKEEKAFSGVE